MLHYLRKERVLRSTSFRKNEEQESEIDDDGIPNSEKVEKENRSF